MEVNLVFRNRVKRDFSGLKYKNYSKIAGKEVIWQNFKTIIQVLNLE